MATRVAEPYRAMTSVRIGTPKRLRLAPQDLRTADATVAHEIASGYFSFGGKSVDARGRSPFQVHIGSRGWRSSLTGFSWLRHLRASNDPQTPAEARALVDEFVALTHFEADDPALEPMVTARRLMSFLAHSPMLLYSAEPDFYQRFLAALARDANALSFALSQNRARGVDRLHCATALLEFCICADLAADTQTRATRLLTQELERQILPDGGHIGRNPQALLHLLLDLAPLRQLFAAQGSRPPQALPGVIDRMTAMLRLLRHGDGSLARFNGMSATSSGELATVFMHEAPLEAPLEAPQSGYQRLEAREGVLIVDVGPPSPRPYSRFAHAGALSFEYSRGSQCVVVNCGAPPIHHEAARELARATAAHSTLTLDDHSSCRIEPVDESGGGLVIEGPKIVSMQRRRSKGGQIVQAAHDGYGRRFGLIHERALALTDDGERLIGVDRLLPARAGWGRQSASEYVLRFHLHPTVGARLNEERQRVEITLPTGAKMLFEAPGLAPRVEESVFFATPEGGSRKTLQIVVTGAPAPDGLSGVTGTYSVTVDNVSAVVEYIGLTPASIGLYQVNFTVPSVPKGTYPLQITIAGQASNQPVITVGN